jgi:hypothetical protein
MSMLPDLINSIVSARMVYRVSAVCSETTSLFCSNREGASTYSTPVCFDPFVVGQKVKGHYSHPKPTKNLPGDAPDFARANDTWSLSVMVEAYKSVE